MVGKEKRQRGEAGERPEGCGLSLGIRTDSREKFSSGTIIDVGGEPPIFPFI